MIKFVRVFFVREVFCVVCCVEDEDVGVESVFDGVFEVFEVGVVFVFFGFFYSLGNGDYIYFVGDGGVDRLYGGQDLSGKKRECIWGVVYLGGVFGYDLVVSLFIDQGVWGEVCFQFEDVEFGGWINLVNYICYDGVVVVGRDKIGVWVVFIWFVMVKGCFVNDFIFDRGSIDINFIINQSNSDVFQQQFVLSWRYFDILDFIGKGVYVVELFVGRQIFLVCYMYGFSVGVGR